MPKALVISRQFPPIGSAGASLRLIKFIKYIADLGWDFVVVTQDPDRPVVAEPHQSKFLLDDIPSEIIVERIPALFSGTNHSNRSEVDFHDFQTNKQYLVGNNQSRKSKTGGTFTPLISFSWGLQVIWHGFRNMNSWNIDIIYSLTPTLINALVGASLSLLTGKPLILDMKDDWVGSPDYYKKSYLRRQLEEIMESTIIRLASNVILVSERSYQLYLKRYEHLNTPHKFHLVPNGCDLAEFEPLRDRKRQINPDRFLVLSAASGYREDYRDITPFIMAVQSFLSQQPSAKEKIEIVFLGRSLSKEYFSLLEKTGVSQYIRELDAVVRQDFIEWLWRADLFFLVQPKGNTTAISGTLHEYWAAGNAPVLLISEEGASSLLVNEYSLGKSFDFDQINQISHYILDIYEKHQENQPVSIDADGNDAFDRKNLSAKMAQIWQESL